MRRRRAVNLTSRLHMMRRHSYDFNFSSYYTCVSTAIKIYAITEGTYIVPPPFVERDSHTPIFTGKSYRNLLFFFLSVNEYTRRTIYRAVDLAAHEHCVLNSTTFRAHELRLENIFLVVLYTDSGVRTAVSQQLIAIGTVKICIIANSLVKTKVSTDSVFNKILTQQQLLGF